MAMRGGEKFTWVIKNPSSLQSDSIKSDRFVIGGGKWHLASAIKTHDPQYLKIFLVLEDVPSFPSGCRRYFSYRLTAVNQHSEEIFVIKGTEGPYRFDPSSCNKSVSCTLSLSKLHDRDGGLIVNGELKLVVELTVGTFSKEDAESNDSGNVSEEGLDGNDKSEEGLDDDDNDDASEDLSSVLDDGDRDKSPLIQLDALEDTSHTVENHGISYNNVEADAWSFVSNVGTASETANNLVIEIQPVDETIDVNGFDVSSSQVESVSHIFKSHPELALGFRRKNQRIRRAYMNELLSLIETLCQSTEKLSEDDLSNAEETLGDLIDVGFKLDWLKTKLNEVSVKKKKEQCTVSRIQTMKEQLQKLKQTFLDLETQLQKEKAEAVAARAPLSFNDVVC